MTLPFWGGVFNGDSLPKVSLHSLRTFTSRSFNTILGKPLWSSASRMVPICSRAFPMAPPSWMVVVFVRIHSMYPSSGTQWEKVAPLVPSMTIRADGAGVRVKLVRRVNIAAIITVGSR